MKSKFILFLLFQLLAFQYVKATSSDTLHSLVKYDELKFTSPFEKEVFEDYFINGQRNYFKLFSALSGDIGENTFELNYKSYLSKLEKLKSQKIDSKKEHVQIKAIYKNVHESFLRKYELINEFTHIFKNGQYNCVSASALYGIIFNDLKIPFTIKETPTHVYIIGFPETHRIMVETTDPNGGFYVFDNRYKANYVNKLKSAKIISSDDFMRYSIDQLFDKYYFTDENINLDKLAGIQYMNSALAKLDDNKHQEAFFQMEKAYLFYPSEKARYLLHYSLSLILADQNFSTIDNVAYLERLSRFPDPSNSNEIFAHFHKISQDYLVNNYRPAYLKEVYEYLMNSIWDEEIRNEISYIYYYENGRISYNKGRYKESVEALKHAFRLKSENSDVQSLFVSAISNSLSRADNSERIRLLDIFAHEYPALLENNIFFSNLLQAYLIQFAQYFEIGNGKEGERYRSMFESRLQDNDATLIDSNLIGRAYSLAAVYYFKKGDNSRTHQMLNQGLKLAPNNFELKQRLSMLKN